MAVAAKSAEGEIETAAVRNAAGQELAVTSQDAGCIISLIATTSNELDINSGGLKDCDGCVVDEGSARVAVVPAAVISSSTSVVA